MTALALTYETIKYYYDNGLWSVDRVRNAVVKGVITPEQFTQITGLTY